MKSKKLTLNNYPTLLQSIPQPPQALYYKGAPPQEVLGTKLAVAIVGSRKISPYGKLVTSKLAQELSRHKVVIVSGLAFGVDAQAHQAAVAEGKAVVAVLACGLDAIYPASHYQLAQKIIECGGSIVSEYPDGVPPLKANFIARNRIISGLSHGVLITEAAERSGSLHTANFALEQGREVFAIPGNITSPTSLGTNNLIKTGATPVTNTQDILDVFGVRRNEVASILPANQMEAALLDLLDTGILSTNELLSGSELSPDTFNQTLTMLEITGKIKALGNGNWSRA